MYRSEREIEILSILEENQYVTVEYIAKKLHISQSSIRRDLTNLESRGIVKRTYGGVELANTSNKVIPFSMRSHENANEKKKIAKAAASLVQNGDIVFIDGSSSTFFMVDYLAKIKDITVITNSIDATYILSQYDVKTICTGGIISNENKSVLVDDFAEKVIKSIHATYCFFSVHAISDKGELYDCYLSEIPLRQLMIENSDKHILLCDSSKFNKTSAFLQGNLKDVDCIITDVSLDDEFCKKFENTEFIVG